MSNRKIIVPVMITILGLTYVMSRTTYKTVIFTVGVPFLLLLLSGWCLSMTGHEWKGLMKGWVSKDDGWNKWRLFNLDAHGNISANEDFTSKSILFFFFLCLVVIIPLYLLGYIKEI